jgi:hypothetical protein
MKIHSIRHAVSQLLLWLSFSFLAACTTITVVPNPLNTTLKANESAAVLSITSNTAQIAGINSISLLRKQTIPDSKVTEVYVLSQILPGLSRDTSVFVGVLPAGEYTISRMSDSKTNRGLSFTDQMNTRLGRILISEGKSADLGRLILTPVNSSVIVGRSAIVTSNMALLKRFSPEHEKLFPNGKVSSGWATQRSADDRVEEYALSSPVGFDLPVETKQGELIGGSRLGAILVRSKPLANATNGRWSTIRGEGLESILSVLPTDLPETKLVAVGELGTLLKLTKSTANDDKPASKLVPIAPGNLPFGNLIFVAGNEKAGWFVACQQGTSINIYKSSTLEEGQWSLTRSETISNNFWSGAGNLWIFHTNSGFGYATSAGKINLLDFQSGQWAERAVPNNSNLSAVAFDPFGTIGILTSPGGGMGGIFASTYLSSDEGRTWQEIKSDFSVKVSVPRKAKSGQIVVVGGVFGKSELHASNDAGKTWKPQSNFDLGDKLGLLQSGNMISVSGGSFGFFDVKYSIDEGKTWVLEHSNFDKAAYDARKASQAKP